MAQDTEAMRLRLQDLKVTASDPNGLAEVSVDSTGALVGLKLTDRINRVAPDVVARTIMMTLGTARNMLADRSKEVIAETVGTESVAAQAIAQSVDSHLRRDLVEEPAQAQPQPRRVDDTNDEDGHDSIYDTRR
jgi:hypothetical protein